MKVLACGSRSWKDKATIRRVLKEYAGWDAELIVGGAAGADRLAEHVGRELKMKVTVVKPRWDVHGTAAGPIRNEKMVAMLADDDVVVAFWDGKSRGTAHTVRVAEKAGIRVRVFSPRGAHSENGKGKR